VEAVIMNVPAPMCAVFSRCGLQTALQSKRQFDTTRLAQFKVTAVDAAAGGFCEVQQQMMKAT
jgi:hypothetical protein